MANKSKHKRDEQSTTLGAVISGFATVIATLVGALGVFFVEGLDLESIANYFLLFAVVVLVSFVIFVSIFGIMAYRNHLREKEEREILEEYSELLEELDSDLESTEDDLFYSATPL